MKKYIYLLVICLIALSAIASAASEPVNFSGDELVQWNHPAKAVFTQNNVNLLEVSSEDQVSYAFSVEFEKDLIVANEVYFDKLVKDIAKAVKFNSFEINDDAKEITISVTCDKGAITQIAYNDNPNYFKDLKAFAEKEKQLRELLLKTIPELGNLEKMVVKNSDGKAKMEMVVSAKPDPEASDKYEKDYYLMAIEQVQGEERDTLDEFLVHKDTNQIVWNDKDNEKYLTIAEWRTLIAKAPYWPSLFEK